MTRLLLLQIIVGVWGFLSSTVSAGMLSSSQNQVGATVNGSPGQLVFLATFSFPSQPSQVFTDMRLRVWIEQSATSAFPQLLFSQRGSDPLGLFAGLPVPLQNIVTSSPSIRSVYEYRSLWMSLSSFDSLRLTDLIGSDSEGKVDAYLYSASTDFYIPQSFETLAFAGRSSFTVSTPYTSTLDLVAVPEPMTAVAFGMGAVALGLIRKRLRKKIK